MPPDLSANVTIFKSLRAETVVRVTSLLRRPNDLRMITTESFSQASPSSLTEGDSGDTFECSGRKSDRTQEVVSWPEQ